MLREHSFTRSMLMAAFGMCLTSIPAMADVVHADDVIVEGSLCVSDDNACANGESFSANTDLKLKDALPRILFQDTSASTSPDRDYRLAVGDAGIGSEYFTIEDAGTSGSGAVQVFRVDGGAPVSSMHIDSTGDVGLGTAVPARELHISDTDTPTLRLDQDGTSFAAQVWDVAGNEGTFRVIDVTNGRNVFAVETNAPANSLYVEDTGEVGLGTSSPDQVFHIVRSGHILPLFESSNGGAIQMRMKSDNANRRFVALNGADVVQSQIVFGDNGEFQFLGQTVTDVRMLIDSSGNLTVGGNCGDSNGGGGGADGCDSVFEPGYSLPSIEEHAAYMWENRHLPAVGPTPEGEQIRFSVQQRHFAVLNELEKAHIYIEQLHERLEEEGRKHAELVERVARLERLAATLNENRGDGVVGKREAALGQTLRAARLR